MTIDGGRIEELATRIDNRIRRPGVEDDFDLYDVTRMHVRPLLDALGRDRQSPELWEELTCALERRGIYPDQELVVENLDHESLIRFSRQKVGPPPQLFEDERTMHEFVRSHPQFVRPLQGLRYVSSEERLPDGSRIDLLFENPGRTEYVVVELKTGDPDRGLSQLLSYMMKLRAKIEGTSDDRHVRGVFITGEAPETLKDVFPVTFANHGIDWYQYEIRFPVTEVRPTTG